MDTDKYEKMKAFLLKGIEDVLEETDEAILGDNYLLGRLYALADVYVELTGDVSTHAERIAYITARDLLSDGGWVDERGLHV